MRIRSGITAAAFVCCIIALSQGYEEPSPPTQEGIRSDWETEYRTLSEMLTDEREREQSCDRAHIGLGITPQIHMLQTDNSPAEVVCRRTGALLAFLEARHGPSSYAALRSEFNQLEQEVQGVSGPSAGEKDIYVRLCAVRRMIAFSNPLLDFDKILFVERKGIATWFYMHYYFTTQYLSGSGEGGLFILNNPFGDNQSIVNVGQTAQQQSTIDFGDKADFLSPDLSYSGDKIAFACKTGGEDSAKHQIYTVNIDGSGLKKISRNEHYWDFDPCFLPGDDRIVFISTRRGGYGRCQQFFSPTYTLHSMKDDGSDVVCLSFHETNEWHPSVDNSGMLLYTRWDYVDRHWNAAHNLWHCGPDGTDPRAYHGNYANTCNTPLAEFNCRAIPGSNKIIATSGPHHGIAFGYLCMIDVSVRDDYDHAQIQLINDGPIWHDQTAGEWGTAWPLSEEFYLCNYRNTISLLDKFGNRDVIYKQTGSPDEPSWNGYTALRPHDPIPVRPRPEPPRPAMQTFQGERAGLPHKPATISIGNVYISDTALPPQTTVKWLRIIQVFPQSHEMADEPRTAYAGMQPCRQPLGIVPVEDDGSVYCEAPIDKAIYFQLLDENKRAVHSMRSVTYVHRGEQMSCLGCHEDKWSAPPATENRKAFQREPSKIDHEISHGFHPFSFCRAVKPVLDAKCLPCHTEKGKGPDMSYESLDPYAWHPEYWERTHSWQDTRRGFEYMRTVPGEVGSYASTLTSIMTREPCNADLTDEEFHRITLWLDMINPRLGAGHSEEEQMRGELVWPVHDVIPYNPTSVEIVVDDQSPPAAVAELSATPVAYGSPAVLLQWKPVLDPESGVGIYNIYRDNTLIDVAVGDHYTDVGLEAGKECTYGISAVNRVGLEGEQGSVSVRADNSNQATTLSTVNPGHGVDTWRLTTTFDRNSNRVRCRVTIPSTISISATSLSISLFSTNGKVIHTSRATTKPGENVFEWRGNHADGPAARGAYYLRVTGPGLHRIVPLVTLRP